MAIFSPCVQGNLFSQRLTSTSLASFPSHDSSPSLTSSSLNFSRTPSARSSLNINPLQPSIDPSCRVFIVSNCSSFTRNINRSNFNKCNKLYASTGGSDGGDGGSFGGGGGGGGGDENDKNSEDDSDKNKSEAFAALASLKIDPKSLPVDFAEAIKNGKIPASIVERFASLQKNAIMRYLMQFGGFKERLLADDLFLTKVGIECGVGIFTKTAAEYERRREKFFEELDFVIADVVMALIADFMLVWLPAPTVSLRAPLASNVSKFQKFLYSCPDNAFQVPLRGTHYNLLQRIMSILKNGTKLLGVGTCASLFGTAATNALIAARKKLSAKTSQDKNVISEPQGPEVKILETSLAYGVYMAISSNLRYQILAGVVEQRMLEPLLHDKKFLLSVLSFIARTGNTFLGSLLWVDYARFVGVQ